MSVKLSLIACVDENWGLGNQNKLLTHLPSDLARFKQLTVGNICVMGRKTFESILDMNEAPLPNRQTAILTRDIGYASKVRQYSNVTVFNDIEHLKTSLESHCNSNRKEEVFICGGGEIYQQLLPYAHNMYITMIHHEFKNVDAFFPKFGTYEVDGEWDIDYAEIHQADEKNPYPYSFVNYKRIRKSGDFDGKKGTKLRQKGFNRWFRKL